MQNSEKLHIQNLRNSKATTSVNTNSNAKIVKITTIARFFSEDINKVLVNLMAQSQREEVQQIWNWTWFGTFMISRPTLAFTNCWIFFLQ